MLPKKCLYCDRRFSKAEHLKRHQRSHTGERPYRCSQCQKSFSRSDVLIRHLKNHPQSSGDGENAPAVDAVDGTQGQIMESSSVDPSAAHIQSESFTPQSVIDPSLQPSSLEGYLDRRSSHPMASGLDHLALLASQQNAGRASMDANMTDAARTPMLHAGEIQDWNFDVSGSNYEPQRMASVSNSQHNHQLKFSNSSPKPLSTSSNSASRFDLGNHMNFTRQNAMQMHMSPAMSGIAQDRSDMMPHELQTWFDQFDMESQMQSDILQDFGSAAGIFHQQSVNPSPAASYSQKTARAPSSPSPSAIIPTERFAKVERCWPNRSSIYGQQRLMLTLWRNCISKAEDNLFSTANLTTETVEQNPQCGSRWGLDDDCRDRLQAIFVTSDNANIDRTSDTFQSPEGLSPSSGRASTVHTDPAQTTMPNPANFPPAEIFDIGLDLYFRQFHPLMPFIHVPTFAPKTAPTSMLLVMCLIGLTVLETKAARAFVRTAFPKTLEKVCNELVSPPRSEEARINQMSSLASAILMLNLSEITGDEKHQVQQLLYTNVIATAQQHGLLSSSESQPLEKKIFDNILDLDAKWKAWSRVESAKRLIICLTMVDTWYSATSHTSPALRLDDLQFILPCDPALFQATSSTKWNQLITRGFPMCMPNVVLSLDKLSLPDLCRPLDVIGMTGILCIIRLRVSESFHRLLSGTSRRAVSQSFVPWKIYELDARAKLTQPLVVQLIHTYGPMLCNMNPNCMTLWHNINIMLLADLRLFELGAGCAGAESARQALDDIAIWTTTAAARRACLHAGQSFRLMSNRRASDGDPFHASSGLFISALILGLYVFMSPTRVEETGHANSGFDLTDEIDWEVVGSEGLASIQHGNVDDAAVNFIRGGGKVRFNGVVHEPGYNSARRILLDYARLLEDIGRWRVKVNQYSRVLRIMSDALVDVDMSGQ